MISMELKDVKFNIPAGVVEDESKDRHLDFDMFDYIYSLVVTVDAYSLALSPLGHPIEKFDRPHANKRFPYDEFGNKIKVTEESSMLHPRVSVDGVNKIFLYSDEECHFDDVLAVCDLYGIKHSAPTKHSADNYYWEWSVYIEVPMLAENYPILIDDYFSEIGVPLEKVMCKRWVDGYRGKMRRLEAEKKKTLNDIALEKAYKKAVTYAWQRGDIPLDVHYAKLIETIEELGLTYKKNLLKNRFMAEFEDDFEEEIAEPTPLFG